jgi:putative ABC transport system permease protein
MVRLTLRTLRYRKGGFVATFIALMLGAMIVMACGGLMETGIRAAIPAQRFAGADLVVTGDRHHDLTRNPNSHKDDDDNDNDSGLLTAQIALDPALPSKLASATGVATAVPDVSFPAYVDGVATSGHNWTSAAAAGPTAGPAPKAGQVVVSTGHVGDTVVISVRGEARKYTVAGILPQPVVYFADEDAAELGRLTAVALTVKPGTDVDDLSSQLENTYGITALTGDDRGAAEFPGVLAGSELLITLAAVFGGFAVMVLMLVVASTLGLSIQQRKQEIALLRAVGTTPRQLRRMVFFEALVLSLLATLAAWVPGNLVGRWLFEQFTGKGVVPSQIAFHQGWVPSVVGIGAAVLTSQVAALAAARRAGNTRPTEALAEAAVARKWMTPTRAIVGTLAALGGLALAIVSVVALKGPIAASTAGPAVLLWAMAFTLFAPGFTRVVLAVLRFPVRAMTKVPGALAVTNARVRRIQLAATVAPVMLAIGFALAQVYTQTTSVKVQQDAYEANLRADFALQSTSGGFSPTVLSQVVSTPGVTAASEWVTSTGFVDAPYDSHLNDDGLDIQGVTASGASALTAVDVAAGSLDALTGDTIALPSKHAEAMNTGVGDTITMRMGDGRTVQTKVVAVLRQDGFVETALMPAALVAAHTDAGVPSQIMVRGSAAGLHIAGTQVVDRSVLTEAYAKEQQTSAWINYLLAGLIVLYTSITVVNTLVVSTADRRREFGLLRLSGARRGQVMRMAGVEGALTAVTGVVLGTAVSAGTLVPFSLAANSSVLPYGPLWIFLVVAGAAALLTMTATLVPAWFATRQRPVDTVVAP